MDDTERRDSDVDVTKDFVRYDPENLPYRKLRLCIYLRELEEEFPGGPEACNNSGNKGDADCPG
jgi:hypothetical protein